MEPILKMEQIVKDFSNCRALDHVNFSMNKGETVAIIGPSGSGKSTLLRCVNCLNRITSGKITLNGKTFVDTPQGGKAQYLSDKELRILCAETGMVFQHFNLFPHMTVMENMTYAPIRVNKVAKDAAKAKAMELLALVGLTEKADAYPNKLSGGQKQRIAIAGIIAMQPECIVLDEPTAMLDPRGREEVLRTIHKLNREKGITIVLITHYMDEAVQAGRVVVMDDGQILLQGTPKEVFSHVELLKQHKLDVPQATELIYRLRASGYPLPECVLNEEDCVAALERILKAPVGR